MRSSLRVLSCLTFAIALGSGAVGSAQTATPASALVKLPSGITLHYVVQGNAGGEPVVLLHGVGDSWHSWELVLPRLPERYRVYAVSLRGHGWSDKPASGYARADFASDVQALLEQLDLRGVTLVGHSLGSLVAQVVAEADRGRRLKRLVLIGSGPGGPRDAESRQSLGEYFRAVRDPIDPGFARDFQAGTAFAPVAAPFFETMAQQVLLVPARVFNELGGALGSAEDVERLATIEVPTLILWGDKDAMFSNADQKVLTGRIPRARLIVYPDTGHAVHWERPERVAGDLLAFLAEADAPPR